MKEIKLKQATIKESRTIRSIVAAAVLLAATMATRHAGSVPDWIEWIKDPIIIDVISCALGLIFYRLIKLKVEDNEKVFEIIKNVTANINEKNAESKLIKEDEVVKEVPNNVIENNTESKSIKEDAESEPVKKQAARPKKKKQKTKAEPQQ